MIILSFCPFISPFFYLLYINLVSESTKKFIFLNGIIYPNFFKRKKKKKKYRELDLKNPKIRNHHRFPHSFDEEDEGESIRFSCNFSLHISVIIFIVFLYFKLIIYFLAVIYDKEELRKNFKEKSPNIKSCPL